MEDIPRMVVPIETPETEVIEELRFNGKSNSHFKFVSCFLIGLSLIFLFLFCLASKKFSSIQQISFCIHTCARWVRPLELPPLCRPKFRVYPPLSKPRRQQFQISTIFNIRRGPKLEGCAFANFGNSSGARRNRTSRIWTPSFEIEATNCTYQLTASEALEAGFTWT